MITHLFAYFKTTTAAWRNRVGARWRVWRRRFDIWRPGLAGWALILGSLGLILLSLGQVQASRAQAAWHEQLAGIKEISWSQARDRLGSVATTAEPVRLVVHSGYWPDKTSPQPIHLVEAITDSDRFLIRLGAGDVAEAALGVWLERAMDWPVQVEEGFRVDQASWLRSLAFLAFLGAGLLGLFALVQHTQTGKSWTMPPDPHPVGFDDVVGYTAVKNELLGIIDRMQSPARYEMLNLAPPRGVLLTGEPGVGKTLLARAVASSCQARFFYCTGADFVEMYVGVGARRVRDLFARARKARRAVIFIDEVDALGTRSGDRLDSERLATLNAILAEMDGLDRRGSVLVIAATNAPHRLDPALRRPGRFDREIRMELPDLDTRCQMLRRGLAGLPLADTVDIDRFALRLAGLAGAHIHQLSTIVRELVMKENREVVDADTLSRAHEQALLGVSVRSASPHELYRVAVHELGHAIAGHTCCPGMRIDKVTIDGRGPALGYALSVPIRETLSPTEEEMTGDIAMLLGGRAAEQVILGSVSAGAGDDLARANALATRMVTELAMAGAPGLLTLPGDRPPGAPLPSVFEKPIRALLDSQYQRVVGLMTARADWLRTQADTLLERRQLSYDELFTSESQSLTESESPPALSLSS